MRNSSWYYEKFLMKWWEISWFCEVFMAPSSVFLMFSWEIYDNIIILRFRNRVEVQAKQVQKRGNHILYIFHSLFSKFLGMNLQEKWLKLHIVVAKQLTSFFFFGRNNRNPFFAIGTLTWPKTIQKMAWNGHQQSRQRPKKPPEVFLHS